MITLRTRLERTKSENGFTLIEVVVAMMVFMIVSTGVLYTMMSLLSVNRDSRNRQVAVNLAAEEIDLARDVKDIFVVGAKTTNYTLAAGTALNGDEYTVTRTSSWVTSKGDVAPCGTGTGTLRFKLVQVEVTWNGIKGDPVTTETYINPNERLNDTSKGSLIIAVTTDHGEPVEKVPVTATPTSGTTLTGSTDSAGCLFMLGVNPNDFTVKISSPPGKSYVDMDSNPQPTQSAHVVAGAAASLPFTFDPMSTIRATYSSASARVPINLSTSLVSTRKIQTSVTTAATNPRSIVVSSAYTEGFAVLSGNVNTCWANDPARWEAAPTAIPARLDGELPEPAYAEPGDIVDATVPMGELTTSMTSANQYLVAVSKNVTTGGQPGCVTQQTLRFSPTPNTVTVALPYGSWDIYRGASTTFSPTSGTRVSTGMTTGANGTIASGVVTFDPRGVG